MNRDGFKRMVDNALRAYGEIDYGRKIIKINKKKAKKTGTGEVIDTIVHEETHLRHPNMKEKNVKKKTARVIKRMGPKVKRRYYARYNKNKHG